MKNAESIKAEAKEQIIKLLDMCKCYTYTEKGIDLWLDTWEKACSPQIETIAEKSPYYDGKCKIVFPSEYPRGYNVTGIYNFCEWLDRYAERNLEPAKINGYTFEDVANLCDFYNYVYKAYNNCHIPSNLLTDEAKDVYYALEKLCTSEAYKNFKNAKYRFANYEGVNTINGIYYLYEDLKKFNIQKLQNLVSIIQNKKAHTQFLNEWLVSKLSYCFPECKFSEGQKLSRAVNRVAAQYGFNKDPEWNKEFAKYADSINPLTVTKWTVISWHPIDYLTYAFGNSWSSCSTIDRKNVRNVKIGSSRSSITSYVDEDYAFRGEHCAAVLSYMFDKTSFIYYTVNHKYDGNHYEEQDKESRIVFSLSEDNTTLLQSRLYPQMNDDNPDDSAYRIPREIVQKIIADALEVPNLWKIKVGSSACRQVCESNGVHYDDWKDERNNKVNISWLTELTDKPNTIRLGHSGICPNCYKEHWYVSSLNCEDCDPMYN